jgi:two-component system, LytTR family, sensor histidine kinase AlgZ
MPLAAAPSAAARPPEILIPDCCNIGIVFRTLVAVNLTVLTIVLVQALNWRIGLLAFVELSMVLELACLWSLFALCGVRRLLLWQGAGEPGSASVQRMLCALVPAAVTALIVHFFSSIDWLMSSFANLNAMRAAMIAGLLGILFQHYFELRTRAFSPALVEARLQALQARIRPHFLFNSLNAVLSLIRFEPRRAEESLEDLADLFRVLMSDPRSMTSLEQELRLCKQYLAIEKIRLGERLQLVWETEDVQDAVLRHAQVPVLLLQPLVENAVHYGVEPSPGPATVRVRIARALDRIEVVVTNPTHGAAQPAPGNQVALENIRERLVLLYDVEAQLTTKAEEGKFEVRLRFPYVKGAA